MPTPRARALMGLFGLRYPIFQGPFGGPELASAVSNAGAMGHLLLTGSTAEGARETVMAVRRQTKQTFVGNYILALPPQSLPAALEAGLPVVQFSWGLPTKELVAAVRQTGAKFGVQVGTAEGARAALDLGADYVVSQGNEAGGHVQSSTPLYELLPRVLEEANGAPVVVAGGIGHGAKIRAALVAGASGALLGTRFVACRECAAHQVYKDALIRAQAPRTRLCPCAFKTNGRARRTGRSVTGPSCVGNRRGVRLPVNDRARATSSQHVRMEDEWFVTPQMGRNQVIRARSPISRCMRDRVSGT
jgi:nitronate monooxygenase